MGKRKGMTLIEMLIGCTILLGMMTAIADLFWTHEHSFSKNSSHAYAQRLSAAILEQLEERVMPAYFVVAGDDELTTSSIYFPPPEYVTPDIEWTGSPATIYTPNYQTADSHYVTLAEDPFDTQAQQLNIQFYRPIGTGGGSIYIYNGAYCNCNVPASSSSNPVNTLTGGGIDIEDLEMWWETDWVVFRITLRDNQGNLVQNSVAAYVRYYN